MSFTDPVMVTSTAPAVATDDVADFNEKARTLLKFMKTTDPDSFALKTLYQSFKILLSLSRKSVFKILDSIFFTPYQSQIRSMDVDFFLADTFTITGLDAIVKGLQEDWRRLPERSQQRIWELVNDLESQCTILRTKKPQRVPAGRGSLSRGMPP